MQLYPYPRFFALAAAIVLIMTGLAPSAQASAVSYEAKLLQPELLERNRQERIRVIALLTGWEGLVGFPQGREKGADEAFKATVAALQEEVLSEIDLRAIRVTASYENLPALAVEVAPGGLKTLAALKGVALIEEDRRIFPRGGGRSAPLIRPAEISPEMRGAGVSIAFIDTGVDYKTVGKSGFPNDKIIGGYDYGDNDPDPMDCYGHGTGMVLIATTWVAPEAKAYAFKICPGCCHKDPQWISKMLAAWDWCVTHKNENPAYPIVAINVSWDNNVYSGEVCDKAYPAVAAAAANLTANGIAVFVASGNNGYCDGMTMPACLSQTFSVGAAYQRNIGPREYCVSQKACYKQKGTKCRNQCVDNPTVEDLVSCCTNSADFLDFLAQAEGRTSGASAYAAGTAAVIQGYFKQTRGRFLSVPDLKMAMIRMAEPVRDRRNNRVKPRLNIYQIHYRLKELDWGVVSSR